MAVIANTFQPYTAIGNREDLTDIIYNISPLETPFSSAIERTSISAIAHEWQTDALATAANNAQLDGDEIASFGAVTPTERLLNRTQISYKVCIISGTQEAVNKAGRKSEVAYQVAKRSNELKRDLEVALSQNNAIISGAAATARQSGGAETWLQTNASRGSGGAAVVSTVGDQPDNAAVPTDSGSPRPLTESLLKNVLQQCFTSGGEPTLVICGPFNKQTISGFSGNSTRMDVGEDSRLVASIDVYKSDYGELKIVPSRFNRERSVLVIDTSMWALGFLRGFRQWQLAKTGDAEKRQILAEWTLESRQQRASGIVADLTTS